MGSQPSDSHSPRNFVICSIASFLLFLIGSVQVLSYFVADRFVSGNGQLGTLSLELALTNTIVISLLAIPLGYAYMYFFGGFVSTRAIKLYLLIGRGTHIVTTKISELESIRAGKGIRLTLRRQLTYFPFILAVVVSFGIYLSKHHLVPVVSPFARTSDVISLITEDYVTLTMSGSLMVPIVALALPYLGGLRLRTIDVGPFHTTILSLVVGVSGGFSLLYSILTQPTISLLVHYLLLFMGVCWCFSIGCNLAADPANRQIVSNVLSEKTSSKLVSSKIWLETPQGQFREV